MQNPFGTLSRNASRQEIYGMAGRLLAQRKAENRYSDFNTEIWYLAGDALERGFAPLTGMTKDQVAQEMGNSISRYLERQRNPR